jgi:GrpB-like predicted nucleotidyltransferase (UPF0157 family)
MKITDLTAQLEQESAETIQQAKQIERDALNMLESDLKRQCSSAVSTLKSDLATAKGELSAEITAFKDDLKTTLATDSKALTDQLARLKFEVAKWSPRMIWAVKWGVILSVIATFAACALVLITTWLWMPRELWNVRTSHQSMGDGRIYLVIDDPDWTTCNVSETPNKRVSRPCKTIKAEHMTLPPAK